MPFTIAEGALRLAVRVTPRASRTRIEGLSEDAAGRPVLRASVTAPPEAGKANAALVALIAKEWRIPKGRIRIAAGASSRNKTLALAGDAGELKARIEGWLAKSR